MIRHATMQDAPHIAAAHVACWRETYTGLLPDAYIAYRSFDKRLEQWQHTLASDHATFVYEDAGHIVGFADSGKLHEPHGNYIGELYSLYVLKTYHGQGIGKQLFEQSRRKLADIKLHPFTTWVLDTNPALAFYMKTGAAVIGERYEDIDGIVVKDLQLGWK